MFSFHPTPGGLLLAAAILAFPQPATAGQPIRILPIGDSITAGALGGPNGSQHGRGGYRYFLERFIEASDGFPNFRFIGSVTDQAGTMASFAGQWYSPTESLERPLKYPLHSGYSGFVIEQITGLVDDGVIPVHQSDVILLQIGTNNVGYGSALPASAAEIAAWKSDYESLLDSILARTSTASVVMAKIPPVADGTPVWINGTLVLRGRLEANAARIEPFNELVVAAVHADYAASHPGRFFLIDNYRGLDPENASVDPGFSDATNRQDFFTGLGDGVHPYNAGHRKMAVNFWNGYQRARGKTETAILTPLDDPDGDGVAGAQVALLGNGGKRFGDGTAVADQPYVLASTDPDGRAKWYLKLDFSGMSKQWDEARFNLLFWGAPAGAPTFGNCCDDAPAEVVLHLYGIPDGEDDWTPADITWQNAPGNQVNGNGINGNFLGEIVVPAGARTGDIVSTSTPALLDFINFGRGPDGLLTFAVVGAEEDPGFLPSFQSSELRDYAPPFVQVAKQSPSPPVPEFRIVGGEVEGYLAPQLTIEFTSVETETYLITASRDLKNYDEVLMHGIAGEPGATTTSVTLPLPADPERMFLRVERH